VVWCSVAALTGVAVVGFEAGYWGTLIKAGYRVFAQVALKLPVLWFENAPQNDILIPPSRLQSRSVQANLFDLFF